jgi:hypothetical protein
VLAATGVRHELPARFVIPAGGSPGPMTLIHVWDRSTSRSAS